MATYRSVLDRTGGNMPGATVTGAAPAGGGFNTIVNNAIPGFNNLTSSASSIVGNLMGGLPSAAPTQRANAYFGAASGMPGSDFVRNRGFDLYGEQAEASKQRGFDNFLKLLSGYSGTVMPTVGQQMEKEQAEAGRLFQAGEAEKSRAHSASMQQSALEGKNYWDPRWKNRGAPKPTPSIFSSNAGRSTF